MAVLLLAGAGLSWLQRDAKPLQEDVAQASSTDAEAPLALPLNWQLTASSQRPLFDWLDRADLLWRPRVERLPSGGQRITYRRRLGEKPLSTVQLRQLMAHPPSYRTEREAIALLLEQLERSGVVLVVRQPKQKGAAGEWNPRRGELRLRPDVASKGTVNFARVLNHEAIHVAQSCKGGSLYARPRLLGLSRSLSASGRRHLQQPLYAKASREQRLLEEEAYANQEQLNLGWELLARHCRSQ
ncbi:hypothetical protein MY494_02665 [Synechococcus sp. A10-1-5-1]|uniref:hypothetical protein n=1 Tax=Synechococcus sp. A10-1-5-1 TaxID=2936507 RepID=UPI002001728C|nr:hypothetical protein [Synechococcus sp. A10-1-5-1]UPM50710.1 hypothetical protein MY494_02665 [Synechococcus sp. A10-1-5-1]